VKLRVFGLPLLAAVYLAAAVAVRLGAQPPAAPRHAPSPEAAAPRVVGVAGCAAAGCHNDQRPAGSPGSEYGAWVHDPHGRAYETVQSAKYRAILDRLAGSAYAEDLCLKCHATPAPGSSPLPRELLADGVGCEGCHGPAEKWRTAHYQGWWKGLDSERKWREYGLYPTKDLARRVEQCAECHVGTADKDVNHDLIAAGHPRLAFEYTAYHHLLPRHWREPHEQTPPGPGARRDFDTFAWAVGQVVTAKAAVELLAARAGQANQPTHPWPEFAEYGCYACHHDLKLDDGHQSWRQKRGFAGTPGEWPWGTWVRSASEALAWSGPDPFADLEKRMRPPMPPPGPVRAAARQALDRLDGWLKQLRSAQPLSAAEVRDRLNAAVARGLSRDPAQWPRDWDEATQHYLSLAALYTALGDLDPSAATPQRRVLFAELRRPLAYPAGPAPRTRFDSPVDFTPEQYRQALQRFAREFAPGTAP
jgi:hypothetical protein